MDFLNWENNQEITTKIGNEKIIFSDKIKKKAFFPLFQDRNILITNKAVYFSKKIELKKRINIEYLYGITYSNRTNQFVIHFDENCFDFLILSEKRDKIIRLLNDLYEEIKKKELLFSIKPDSDLSKYVVFKKEKKTNPHLCKLDKNDLYPIKEFLKLESLVLSKIKNNFIKKKVLKIKKDNGNIDVIYPEEENIDTNNLITLIFQSGDQLLRYAIICKNTDIFNVIVNKIFEREPKFKENFNYFLCNGNRVNEYKSLDENNIKDGNFIILQNLE